MHVGLIETRADTQFSLWRQHSDLHVLPTMYVEQARGAQGAPQSGESCANNQKLLFHDRAPVLNG
ncbi:hypothetical protein D3C79_902830 [compost metagenome]